MKAKEDGFKEYIKTIEPEISKIEKRVKDANKIRNVWNQNERIKNY